MMSRENEKQRNSPVLNLLMISGDRLVVRGKQGPFYSMLEVFSQYWKRIDVICPGSVKGKNRTIHAKVFFHHSPVPLVLQPIFIVLKGYALHKNNQFHLIVSHDYGFFYNGIGACILHTLTGIPWISEIHHIEGHPYRTTWGEQLRFVLANIYVRLMKNSVAVFRSVNKQVSEKLREWSIPEHKIMCHSSVYLDRSVFFKKKECVKKFDFIVCTRLEHDKGGALLLEILTTLVSMNQQFTFVVIGSGSQKNALIRKLVHLGIRQKAIIKEWIEDENELADYYRHSRLFLCLSPYEGNPRVVFEALACGIPVLSAAVGRVPEIVKDGYNGYIVPHDGKSFADKIMTLLRHPADAKALEKNSYIPADFANREETVQSLARKYIEVSRQQNVKQSIE